MAVTQLNPPIPMSTPKGDALAHVMIDYGPEYHILWVCFQDDTGECWTWQNPQIRGPKNVTMGRTSITPIAGVDAPPPRPLPLRAVEPVG